MKKSIELVTYRLAFLFMTMMASVYSFAQDATNVTVEKTAKTTTTEQWYTEPWVWIVGGALLFILLLGAILGGGSRSRSTSDTRVHRTTITRQDDVYDA
ncbi:hypothetical protein [Polluticoccus soli]|uniref:hypothetical protein n=1 Tax=Polluticoccus soli TaxID=3034150 RepID=UPI0023E0C0FF|nr:hypothetical protein [Flavipsychrobacter sp. JY13-12]